MLGSSEVSLAETYDLAMFDLDGVVYIGEEAVPGAAHHLARLRHDHGHLAFITNNASRTPEAVAEKLVGLGVEAVAEEVVTSAQAAARVLLDRFGPGAAVAVLGAAGLEGALVDAGLVPRGVDDHEAAALVSGYGPEVPWGDIMRAAVRVRDGLPWVASNTDRSFPTPGGIAPGHGVLVDMLSRFAGVAPVVAGKPARPLLDETVRRVGGRRPLMVGDRLDTDILGGHEAGVDSLLVMTGVSDLDTLVAAPIEQRPTYLAPDLAGLFEPHASPRRGDRDGWSLGGWTALADTGVTVTGTGSVGDWWRVVATAAWRHLDDTGTTVDTSGLVPPTDPGDG